jgi:uncharacterized membrane protein
VAWALEGAALLWLFHRVPHMGLRHTALGLIAIACARLFTSPAITGYVIIDDASPAMGFYFTFGMIVLALVAAALWTRGPQRPGEVLHLPSLCYILTGITLFLLMNVQIAHGFSEGQAELSAFEFDGRNFARDMAYTIGWSAFAFTMLVLGFRVKQRSVRVCGIALLGIALLKLFFHDLSSVAGIYRIGALFVVAVLAFAASFLYQRFAQRDPA